MTRTSSNATTRGGFDPSSVSASLRRSFGVLVIVAALVAGAAFFILDRVPAMYFAETRVMVGVGESDPARRAKAMDGEVQLIRSQDIARTAVASVGLAREAEYIGSGIDDTAWRRLLVGLGFARDLRSLSPEERVLALYDENLAIGAVPGSTLIRVGFWSSDPVLAAGVANAVAGAYTALRQSATDEAVALRAEIERLEEAIRTGETRASILRDELAAKPPVLDEAARSELLAAREAADARLADARRDAAAIRAALAAGTLPELAVYGDDPAVRALVAEQEGLRADLARELVANPLGSPLVAEIGARLGAIQLALQAESERIAAALEAEAEQLAAEVAAIEVRLGEADAAADAARALADLEAAIAADRGSLEAALNRQAALGQGGALPTSVRVLGAATVPATPDWPDIAILTALAFLVTLLLGIVLVVLRDILTGRAFRHRPFEPLADIEQPAPAAARMRRVEDDEAPRARPGEPSIAPAAPAEASLRAVADSIAGRRRIVVTLAEDSDTEGRPLAAVALARALAARDRTVILVDLQPDGANVSAMGEIAELTGFADLLSGDTSFSQAIFRDRRSRAHFIPPGIRPLEPTDLKGDRLATLLTALDHTYDHVVIDCPDAAISRIAPPADAALVVSDFGSADPRTVRAVSRVARVSDALVFHLLVDPARRPPESARAA